MENHIYKKNILQLASLLLLIFNLLLSIFIASYQMPISFEAIAYGIGMLLIFIPAGYAITIIFKIAKSKSSKILFTFLVSLIIMTIVYRGQLNHLLKFYLSN